MTEEREVLKRDVFLYAYGSNLPDPIRQEIRSSILNQTFYRNDLIVDWEFSLVEGNTELMAVKKRYSYIVKNNSSDKREWTFSFVQIGADALKSVAGAAFVFLRITRGQDTVQYLPAQLFSETTPDQPHTRGSTRQANSTRSHQNRSHSTLHTSKVCPRAVSFCYPTV